MSTVPPSANRLSLSARAARNLATATVTVPQNSETTPRWLQRLLPWVDVDGGVYRINRRKIVAPRRGLVSTKLDGGKAHVEVASLHHVPLFFGAELAALAQVASQFVTERHDRGALLATEGAALRKFIILVEGKLEISHEGPHGERLRQAPLTEGAFYGEEALLSEVQAPAIKALTPVTVLTLDKQKFSEAIDRTPGFREALEKVFANGHAAAAHANGEGERKIDLLTAHSGERRLPTAFVDYEEDPREYHLSRIQTVLQTNTRVTDLYSNKIDQLREQVRLTVQAVKEREESEILNSPDFGLLNEVAPAQRIPTRTGPPTPDDLDELLTLVWKKPAFFLAHPRAIAAFGRECTRRGVPPPTVNIYGSPFITWRGVPLIPSDKLAINGVQGAHSGLGSTSILLLRVGEAEGGVVGLQKVGVTGEVEPGLSVRYMGTDEHSIASHLVTRYFSAAVLTEDAIARLDHVLVGHYHDYVYPKA